MNEDLFTGIVLTNISTAFIVVTIRLLINGARFTITTISFIIFIIGLMMLGILKIREGTKNDK